MVAVGQKHTRRRLACVPESCDACFPLLMLAARPSPKLLVEFERFIFGVVIDASEVAALMMDSPSNIKEPIWMFGGVSTKPFPTFCPCWTPGVLVFRRPIGNESNGELLVFGMPPGPEAVSAFGDAGGVPPADSLLPTPLDGGLSHVWLALRMTRAGGSRRRVRLAPLTPSFDVSCAIARPLQTPSAAQRPHRHGPGPLRQRAHPARPGRT